MQQSRFLKEIADPTFNHEVLADAGVVHPPALGETRSRVDTDRVREIDNLRGGVMPTS